MQKPLKRRLYTEILTDESEDGTYIRENIREKCPNLWTHLSSQLNQLHYKFPEMPESLESIPTALLD